MLKLISGLIMSALVGIVLLGTALTGTGWLALLAWVLVITKGIATLVVVILIFTDNKELARIEAKDALRKYQAAVRRLQV